VLASGEGRPPMMGRGIHFSNLAEL